MASLFVTTREGREIEIAGETGHSVMEIIRNAGIDEMMALCGGCCSCATCHVFIDQPLAAFLVPMSEDENDLLDSSNSRAGTSRLSCQIEFGPELHGLRVTIAPEE